MFNKKKSLIGLGAAVAMMAATSVTSFAASGYMVVNGSSCNQNCYDSSCYGGNCYDQDCYDSNCYGWSDCNGNGINDCYENNVLPQGMNGQGLSQIMGLINGQNCFGNISFR